MKHRSLPGAAASCHPGTAHSGTRDLSKRRHPGTAHSGTRDLPKILCPALFCLLLLAFPTFADYQSGLDAYTAGHFTTAMAEWQAVAALPAKAVAPGIYAETHYAIGMLYWQGQGVTRDYFAAEKWFRKAADLGSSGAQAKLGYMYAQGVAVRRDPARAFAWFERAARQGDVDGQYNLGIYYLNGWATKQDKTLAAQYLAAAAAQGDAGAERKLQQVLAQIEEQHRHSGLEPESTLEPESSLRPAAWILQQEPRYYTLQVIALRAVADLEKMVAGHPQLAPFATYTQQLKQRPLHVLIQGVYPDVDAARAARAHFPASIQKRRELWIRQFDKIQALIRARGTGF